VNFNKISDGFGERFKTVLKKHKVTQAKFAEDTNTHKGLVSRYINGERPSGDFILKAVAYFPKEIQYLFFEDNLDFVNEDASSYNSDPQKIILDIEEKLRDLKRVLSQK
tara:strand:- start:150 stop:476 length:327 start_codon:yes stop_codon:yes gene_type:complete